MPSLRTLLVALPLVAFPLCAFACSSSSSSSATTSSPTDASTSDAPSANAIVVPNDATITYKVFGGIEEPVTQDSGACTIDDETFTFAMATGLLTWKACVSGDAGLKQYDTGSKTLDASGSAPLRAMITSLQSVTPDNCISEDAPATTLEIDSPEATSATYANSCFDDASTPGFTAHGNIHDELIALSGLTGLVNPDPS